MNIYIKTFDEFLNEEIKWNPKNVDKHIEYYNVIKHEIPTYDWKMGEKVLVKHPTWKEARVMDVVKTGRNTELQAGVVNIDLGLGLSKYEFIIPMDRLEEIKATFKKKREGTRRKTLTKKEYISNIKDAVSGHEDADYSTIWDLAENLYHHFDHWDLVDYMNKHVDEWYNWTKTNIINQMVNDMEQYLK